MRREAQRWRTSAAMLDLVLWVIWFIQELSFPSPTQFEDFKYQCITRKVIIIFILKHSVLYSCLCDDITKFITFNQWYDSWGPFGALGLTARNLNEPITTVLRLVPPSYPVSAEGRQQGVLWLVLGAVSDWVSVQRRVLVQSSHSGEPPPSERLNRHQDYPQ